MFHNINLPNELNIPNKMIDLYSSFNILKMTKDSLALYKERFRGFETYDDLNIMFFYFTLGHECKKMKGFEVILDWASMTTQRCVIIKNEEQVTKDIFDYIMLSYTSKYTNLIAEFEKAIIQELCHIFLKKIIAVYFSDITNIPIAEDQEELNKIGMMNAIEIEPTNVYIDDYDITTNMNQDNW